MNKPPRRRTVVPAPSPETQVSRYRRLSAHVVSLERSVGEVRVRFDWAVPPGLLARTLDAERRCCQFVRLVYDEHAQVLSITVQNVDQVPRLDSLEYLLQPSAATRPALSTTRSKPTV